MVTVASLFEAKLIFFFLFILQYAPGKFVTDPPITVTELSVMCSFMQIM